MTAFSYTNTIDNGTTGDADEVQQNFDDAKTYINASVVRKDGATAMAAALTLDGNDPTNAAHAVQKAYADGPIVLATGGVSQTWPQSSFQTVKFDTEVRDGTNGLNASTNYNLSTGVFTVPKTGLYLLSVNMLDGLSGTTAIWQTRWHVLGGTAVDLSGPTVFSGGATGADPKLTFSVAWWLTSGQTVQPQVQTDASSNPSKTLGAWLSIVWLHG